eukprot:2388536-Karenia_brevis.AAC.1
MSCSWRLRTRTITPTARPAGRGPRHQRQQVMKMAVALIRVALRTAAVEAMQRKLADTRWNHRGMQTTTGALFIF